LTSEVQLLGTAFYYRKKCVGISLRSGIRPRSDF